MSEENDLDEESGKEGYYYTNSAGRDEGWSARYLECLDVAGRLMAMAGQFDRNQAFQEREPSS